jgi:Na+-driven multidrug efflux pump
MYVTSASIWVIRVPAALLLGLVLGLGVDGAWLGMAIDLCARRALFFACFRSGQWTHARV